MATKELSKNHERYWVPGLARGLEILNIIAEAQQALPIAEISKRVGLSRSSVFRLTYTLEHLGYIQPVPGGRGYDLSSNVLRLGYAYLAGRDLVSTAQPVLEQLAHDSGLSTHLGVLSGTAIVYLIHIPGHSGYVSTIRAGDRLPAHATPMGLAILSGHSAAEIEALYKDAPLEVLTDKTPSTVAQLVKAVAAVRSAGSALSYGSVHPGGQSVAAPVLMQDGSVRAAVGISGPDSALADNELEERMRPLVVAAALEISRLLGHVG